MTTLTAWAFPGADDAEEAIRRLDALQSQGHITIDDAALVSWEPGKKDAEDSSAARLNEARSTWRRLLGHVPGIALPGAVPRGGNRRRSRCTEHLDDRHGNQRPVHRRRQEEGYAGDLCIVPAHR